MLLVESALNKSSGKNNLLIIDKEKITLIKKKRIKEFCFSETYLMYYSFVLDPYTIPTLYIIRKENDEILERVYILKKDIKKIKKFLNKNICWPKVDKN